MSHDRLYEGPGPFDVEPVVPQELGDYTVADQVRGFGVPEDQLVGEDAALYRKVEAANNEAASAIERGEVLLGGTK